MTLGYKTIGFTFSVETPTEVTVTPQRQNVVNTFDLIGDLLTTPRLKEESNASYKQRLMDVNVHPGSPAYDGVVNNLTREFGYTRAHALTITLNTTSAGDYVADSPRVDFLANRVILYSDWRPDGTAIIDKEIDIYSPGDAGYTLEGLVSEINSSTCFTASIASGARTNMPSTNLIRKTSDNIVFGDPIEGDKQTNLSGELIVLDSLIFSDKTIFDTETSSAPAITGEYQVDYTNGIITTYDLPSGTEEVSYHYSSFPLEVDYSSIKVYTLQDDDFVDELFIQETAESGDIINTLPNTEGSEIFHQLFKETKVFWGV